jgi:putative phosphoribosyl transferase
MNEGFYYESREEAAHILLPHLSRYRVEKGVVVAIPRGGIPVGNIVAMMLNWPLLPLLIKKIGHPDNPEFAVGYVTDCEYHVNTSIPNLSRSYIVQEVIRLRKMINDQKSHYNYIADTNSIKGKTAILIDDGMATGSSILAGIRMLKSMKSSQVIVAVPVAAPEAIRLVKKECDQLICPFIPADFIGVGQYYRSFPQLDDEEAWRLVNER